MALAHLLNRTLKLGKRAAKPDSRNLKLEKYLSLSRLPSPPEEIDYSKAVDKAVGTDPHNPTSALWGMYANDQIGDCGPAGCAHQIMAWTGNVAAQVPPPASLGINVPAESDVIKFYSLLSGYDPAQTDPRTGENPTDTGVDLNAMYNAWKQVGLGGNKIAAFATLSPSNPEFDDLLVTCIWLFGSAGMGIQLPIAYQPQQMQKLGLIDWLAPSNHHLYGIWQPGSWGGHYVPLVGYGATRLRCITWGAEQLISYNALHMYCDEIKIPLSQDWFNGSRSVSGFDIAALKSDLNQIR